MRRADRLFEIIQILRRRKIVRASDLAEALEVSERTVYRDIKDLAANGVPIDGEAGVGYILRSGYDLPPLMFNEQEIEALVLGARIVETWTDPALAEAANNVVAKVEAVIPERLRQHLRSSTLLAPANHKAPPISIDLAEVRHALRHFKKLHLNYQDAAGLATERDVRPLALSFFGPVWLLAAWCELREDFRSFRLDRIETLERLDAGFKPERGKTLQDYLMKEDR